jgi:hypothetical protein
LNLKPDGIRVVKPIGMFTDLVLTPAPALIATTTNPKLVEFADIKAFAMGQEDDQLFEKWRMFPSSVITLCGLISNDNE